MLILTALQPLGMPSFPCQLEANPHPREPSTLSHAHTLDSWFSLEAPTLLPASTLLPHSDLHEGGRADYPQEDREGWGQPSEPHPSRENLQLNLDRHFSEGQVRSFRTFLVG